MSNENPTTEKLTHLRELKLSDSARARMQTTLSEYAAFHSVRVGGENRLLTEGQLPTSVSLFSLRFTFMPLIILLAVMTLGGTTFAAQGAVPGDFLYPIKTDINENIRAAFAIGNDSEAKLQATLLAERVEEAETLRAEGRLSGAVADTVASNISVQAKVATAASANSSAVVATETKAKIQSTLNTALAMADLNVAVGTSDSGAVMATTLAKKQYEIGAFKAAVHVRTTSLAALVKKYQAEIDAKVYADLTLKLETAAKLSAEAETQAEADARVTLEKASTLDGEVEAKLSTLGQVEIGENNGLITDIDFSIDPMQIDRGEESTTDGVPADPRAAQSSAGVEGDINVKGSLDSDMMNVSVDGGAAVNGGASLGI